VTSPVGLFARPAAYRFLGAPNRSDCQRRDCTRGDRTVPRARRILWVPFLCRGSARCRPDSRFKFPFLWRCHRLRRL